MVGIARKKGGELYFASYHSTDEILLSVIEESGLFKIGNNDVGEVVLETIHLSVAEFSAAAHLLFTCTESMGSKVGQSASKLAWQSAILSDAAAYFVSWGKKSLGYKVGQSSGMNEERKKAIFRYLMELCIKTESNNCIIFFYCRQKPEW